MKPTKSAPEDKLPPALQGPDLVTAIRVYGSPGEHPLPVTEKAFSVGSSATCDVRLTSEYISPTHCMLVRGDQRLRVEGQDPHIFFRGHKKTSFEIIPGDTFHIATTRLLALSERMRLARPVLSEILGRDQESAIDRVLITSVLDDPILIVGPRGAGQSNLARSIHDMSTRRAHPFIDASHPPTTPDEQERLIQDSRRGTLVVPVAGEGFDETFLNTVLSSECRARLVLLAPSFRAASRVNLGPLMPMGKIEIRPLRERSDEIPQLLELQFARNGSCVGVDKLTSDNRDRLLRYHWPDNLDGLRQIGAIIGALLHQGSIRRAADALGMPRSTMQYWIKRFQLTVPLKVPASPPLECPVM